MKHIILTGSICFLSLFATSCIDSVLETNPSTEYSDPTVWGDPALVEAFVNQIYFRLDEPFQGGRFKACLVDEAHYRGNSGSRDFNNCLQTQDNLPGWSAACRYRSWDDLYKTIRSCNLFFKNVDQVQFSSEIVDGKTERDRMTGEVTFLRAFVYFHLVSTYGGVPLITDAYELNDDFQVERNTFAECIDFIVNACDEAAALLPDENTGENYGRATRGAALALKSRVLLYAASDLYNTTVFPDYAHQELIRYTDGGDRRARWQAAKDAAKAVIDLNQYQLYKADPAPTDSVAQNIVDLFLSKESEEDIFVKFFTSVTGQMTGLYTAPNGYHGWGSNAPLGDMVDAYEMADGSKFDWDNPEHAAHPYQNREPRFYANVLYEGAPWGTRPDDVQGLDPYNRIQVGTWHRWNPETNEEYEQYGVYTRNSTRENWNGSYTGYYSRKFVDPSVSVQFYYQTVTWRFFRYAEILLNYAEACIELGEDAEACRYINMIRHRAGLPDINLTGDALKEAYRHERRIELCFEDHRFFDVRRWVIGPEAYHPVTRAIVVYPLNPDHTTATEPTIRHEVWEQRAWNDKAYFLPILRDEMDKNSLLIQNPGY